MKRLFIIYLIILPFAINTQERKLTWDYPVKPGSEEWRMTSYAEKVEKSQPPKALLNSWDTETLFEYCVNYPFNKVTLLFNNPNDGFKFLSSQDKISLTTFREKTDDEYFINESMDSMIITKA